MLIFRSAILAVLPLIFLAGCGQGWETRAYNGIPYGERTAGAGVEYVRTLMLPKKGPVLDLQMPKEEKDSSSEGKSEIKVKGAEPLFDKQQAK